MFINLYKKMPGGPDNNDDYGDYPETYDEDQTQRIVPSNQRRGIITDRPAKFNHLLQEDHWLNALREDYNAMDFCKQSGRFFNGSDPILKNIESKQFKDPNQVYQSRYTMESSYIYIISKVIGENQYYKVGEGGSGDKSSGPGRLGDAQTFLPFGLNEDVGYRVHYLLFFPKRYHPNVTVFLGKFIEMRVHSNLRLNFRSASITFENGKPSEWYLVPKNDLCIFLGFIFDIVSSYKVRPLQIWKLVSSRVGKEIVKLEAGWTTRMSKNPDNIERDDITNIGSNIVIKMNYEEDVGSVVKFKNNLLGDFVLPNQRAALRYSYTVTNIILNKKELKEGQPLQINTFYGIVTSLKKTFDELVDIFLNQEIDISKFEITLKPEDGNVKAKFYISIKDLLQIHKLTKYAGKRLFDRWALKSIYNYYHGSQQDDTTDTYEMPNNFVAPPWFFNSQIQLAWAHKMTTEEEFMYHTDYLKDYNNNSQKYNWKSTAFYTEQFANSGDYLIERERVNENKDIIPNTKEGVPILRIMNVMSVHEIQPTGKKPREKHYEKTIDGWTVEGHSKRLVRGGFVELKDDYFTYYKKNGEADDITKYKGKTMYLVKKIYEKTNHSANLNPWMDVQQFPSTRDKRIWCILLPDFTDEKLKGKLIVKATTENEIKKLKKKLLDEEAAEDRGGFANELLRVANPLFKAKDIIRMKPVDFISDHRFGEDETKRDEYHYAKIINRIKEPGETKSVQYEITYFPPWDTNDIWGLTPATGKYVEKHRISQIDEFAEKVNQTNEEFKIYKDNLRGKYVIESIVDNFPKYDKLTSHEEFIAKAEAEGDEPMYFVKWDGYAEVEKDILAVGLYEDAPEAVKEYWKRSLPFSKRVTRSDTRNANRPPIAGGRRTCKRKKRPRNVNR